MSMPLHCPFQNTEHVAMGIVVRVEHFVHVGSVCDLHLVELCKGQHSDVKHHSQNDRDDFVHVIDEIFLGDRHTGLF